jgi:hypothetical protein
MRTLLTETVLALSIFCKKYPRVLPPAAYISNVTFLMPHTLTIIVFFEKGGLV